MNARLNEKHATNLAHRQGAGVFGDPLRIGDLASQCGEQARFGFHLGRLYVSTAASVNAFGGLSLVVS